MAKLTVEIPDGEYCFHMYDDIFCKLYNANWNKCYAFNKEMKRKYADEDEIDLLGFVKCKECVKVAC